MAAAGAAAGRSLLGSEANPRPYQNRIAEILLDADYRGYISLEFEGQESASDGDPQESVDAAQSLLVKQT